MLAPEKTLRYLKSLFFLPPSLQANTTQNQALEWWNIWPIALFGMPAPEETFRDLKSCFFLPPSLQPITTPKSSPGMVEYLAYSSVWNACA